MSIDVEDHMREFIDRFLVPSRRDRWHAIMLTSKAFKQSHKILAALDSKRCTRIDGCIDVKATQAGVFYDFYDPPRVATFKEAVDERGAGDAIFSIVPGKHAIFLFHESEDWLCIR